MIQKTPTKGLYVKYIHLSNSYALIYFKTTLIYIILVHDLNCW